MKKNNKLTILLVLLTSIIIIMPLSLAVSGQFTTSTSMKYTGTSSDPGTFYQDAVGGSFGNADVGIKLCDVGQRYVGAFYALKVGATWYSSLVTYSSSTNALAQTTSDVGGGCYEALPGFVTVSPSYLTTPNPSVYRAALPANLYIGYAASANPGSISDFVYSQGNAKLSGDYTVPRSFTQSSRQVTISTPTITFTSTSGSFSKSATDSNFGINSERRMVLGICDDDHGEGCSDGGLLTSATFPVSLDSGLSSSVVNDQQTSTKYVVLNGIGKQMCIGANLQAQVSVTPDPIYYSQVLNITITLTNPRDSPYELNGGNVETTTAFDVSVKIYEQGNPANEVYSTSFEYTGTLVPDASYQKELTWPAIAHSGNYVVAVTADYNNEISECSESDNDASTSFELKPVTIPELYIDGVQTNTFDYPNVPYKLDLHMKNSDNDVLSNATVYFTEVNGLSLTSPTQIYNRTIDASNSTIRDGIITSTISKMITDYYGNISFTYIPTYNDFYNNQYSYINLVSYVGNYSLELTGNEADGSNFKFIDSGILYDEYRLNLGNTSFNGTYTSKTIYKKSFVAQVLDFAYNAYTNFLQSII